MPEISPLIRLFVSSTFADFTFEREVLQRAVFPRLRALCAAQGFRFQPIDLRWGVSEEAGNEKRTLAICLDEIARCQRLSPDLNFLILLGDRYGSCFLPERIPSDQMTRLIPYLAPAERDTFAQAYKEDLNALPPEYVLLPSEGAGDARQVEEPLRMALAQAAQAAGFSEQELLPFVASATHLEIQRGLLDAECDPSAALCAIRSFDSLPEVTQAAQYVEQDPGRRAQLEALKAAVEQHLGGRVWRYSAPGQITGPRMGRAARARYKALAEQFYALLEPRIQDALALRQAAAQTRDPGAEANRQFAASRASVVVGREEALDIVATYLDGQASLPLVVTGESGVGKSTLLARAVEDAASKHPNAVIVTRYIGVTPGTSSLADLLSGLRREIAERYNQPAPEPLGELSQLVAAFASQLGALEAPAERPLFLVVDALDQLSAQPQRVDWLPRTLARHVRVVLSTLPDRQELANLRSLLPETQSLQLEPLTRAQGADALRAWLAAEGRHLTSEQENAVLDGFAPAPDGRGTPLYLRLAFEQARIWRSFDHVEPLPPTVVEVIQAYLRELEQNARHGRELVAHALGYLVAAHRGLAEDEMLDILPRSAAVRVALRRLNSDSPAISPHRPLPAALWARLAADLERYLTEVDVNGVSLLTFFHRQVHLQAEECYLAGAAGFARHQELAAYFDEQPYELEPVGSIGSTPGAEGAARVYATSGRAATDRPRAVNSRKLAELAQQLAASGPEAQASLEFTLTDGRFLEGKLASEGVNTTLEDLALVDNAQDIARLAHAVRAGAGTLERYPEELVNQVIGRVGWVDRLHDLPSRTTPWLRLRGQSLSSNTSNTRLETVVDERSERVALSADGQRAFSAYKGTVKVWAVTRSSAGKRLQPLSSWAKPESDIHCLALSKDGRTGLVGLADRTLLRYDAFSGQMLQVCGLRVVRPSDNHQDEVLACALSAHGDYLLTASKDSTLRFWSTTSGKTLQVLEGHNAEVFACALSADGRVALSASRDGTLRVWDTPSGQLHYVLVGGHVNLACCALSPDGRVALSSSDDRMLRVWDLATGTCVRTLTGHRETATSCALSAHGDLALSISQQDETVRMWDVEAGTMRHCVEGVKATGCTLSADGNNAIIELQYGSYGSALDTYDVATGRRTQDLKKEALDLQREAWDLQQPGWRQSVPEWLLTFNPFQVPLIDDNFARADGGKLALSGDGTKGVTLGSKEGYVWELNGSTVQKLHHLYNDSWDSRYSLKCYSLSADGRIVACAFGNRTLSIWDTSSATLLQSFHSYAPPVEDRHSRQLRECALSGDGRIALSASQDNTMRVWDTATGVMVHKLDRFRGRVYSCALSADGRIALSACDSGTLDVWDTKSGQSMHRLEGHTRAVSCCALSDDGRLALSGSDDRTVRVWDTATGITLRTLSGLTNRVVGCALSADGRLALACEGSLLHVWYTSSGEKQCTLDGHTLPLVDCALSADGAIAFTTDGSTLRLWDTSAARVAGLGQSSGQGLSRHTGEVRNCALSADGKRALSASADLTLRVWETEHGTCLQSLEGHTEPVTDCALSADGHVALSASRDYSLRVWDVVDSGRVRTQLVGHTNFVWACALSSNGRIALSASSDKTLRIWDTTSGAVRRILTGHSGTVWDCDLSRDERLALSASDDGTLRLWDVRNGKLLRVMGEDARRAKNRCALSPNGRIALASLRGGEGVEVWDTVSGQLIHTFETRFYHIRGRMLSATWRLMSSGSSLIDLATEQTVALWHSDAMTSSSALSHDGRLIVCGDEAGGVHFLDVVGIDILGASTEPERLPPWLAAAALPQQNPLKPRRSLWTRLPFSR